MPESEPVEMTEKQAVEEVKLLAAMASSTLPVGYPENDEDDPATRLAMNSTFDVIMYSDGYALVDGCDFSPGEVAMDILSLLAVFKHFQKNGIVK